MGEGEKARDGTDLVSDDSKTEDKGLLRDCRYVHQDGFSQARAEVGTGTGHAGLNVFVHE